MNNDSSVSVLGRLNEVIAQHLAEPGELWVHGDSRIGKSSVAQPGSAKSALPSTPDGDIP